MFFKAATIHQFEHQVREIGLEKGVTELLLLGQVIFAGIYHSFAMIVERAPFEAVIYARAADADLV